MLLHSGRVQAANSAARTLLAGLGPDEKLPEECAAPGGSGGLLVLGGQSWRFTATPAGDGLLLLLRPAPDQEEGGVTARQMDGALRRLREQLSSLLLTAQLLGRAERQHGGRAGEEHLARLNHSFCQMLRLVDRLDLVREPDGDLPFSPVTMDLAGLCRQVVATAAPLLERAGIFLDCRLSPPSLLISGDPELLHRLILELVSNGAAAAGGEGRLSLSVTLVDQRAVLTCTNAGREDAPSPAALFAGTASRSLPRPGEGAGLGLTLVQRIVKLHKGTLVMVPGQDQGLSVMVALPTAPAPASLTLRSPKMEYGGGLSPLLVELSEVLPDSLYSPEELR